MVGGSGGGGGGGKNVWNFYGYVWCYLNCRIPASETLIQTPSQSFLVHPGGYKNWDDKGKERFIVKILQVCVMN